MENWKILAFGLVVLGAVVQGPFCKAQEDCDGNNQKCHEACSKKAAKPTDPDPTMDLNNCWDDCDEQAEGCLSRIGM